MLEQQHKLRLKIKACKFFAIAFILFGGLLLAATSGRIVVPQAHAAIAQLLNFQGKLTNVSDGTNIADGSYSMQFKIYSVATGGTALWTETWDGTSGTTQVSVVNGVFSVKLGTYTSLSSVDFSQSSLYLGVNFNSGTGYDGEMTPRKQLVASPYAFNANAAIGSGRLDLSPTDSTNPGGRIQYAPTVSSSNNALYVSANSNVTGAAVNIVQNGTGTGLLFGTTPLGGSTQTILGANPATFASSNFVDFQVASTSQFKVDATGDITNAGTITSTGQINATGGLSVAANQNLTLQSGNGSINQTYLSSGTSSDDLFSFTDTNSGGSNSAQNGIAVQPVGTATSGGTNTINGEKFLNVTPVTNNTFQALNFGTGYNSLVVYNGNTLINGSGVLQSAALSGTYSNTLTLSNATNAITAGTLTATGGTINGTSIGSTTASTASFTTVNTTGSVGINTASVSGNLDVRQIANGNTIIYSRRFTDSSPTGNFIDYQNAAATSDLFKVDVSGNTSVQNLTINGTCTGCSSGTTAWSTLANPAANLALSMGSYTSTFTYGSSTGANNLFNLTDTTGNTSATGNLLNITTASNSTLNPLNVAPQGTSALTVASSGQVTSNLLTVQTPVNSTSAFQVENATSEPVFLVDDTSLTNIVSNPGFEASTTGWTADGSGGITQSLTQHYHGLASLRISTPATANTGAYTNSFSTAITSSTQYTFSFYALDGGTAFSTLTAGYSNNGSTKTACSLNNNIVLSSGWQRYSCTFTTGTVSGSPYIYITQSDANARIFYVDAVQLQIGATATPYSIGNIQLRGIVNSPATFQSTSNSTTAFQIQDSASSENLFVANTLNGKIGIGTASPNAVLNIVGNGTISGGSATISSTGGTAVTGTGTSWLTQLHVGDVIYVSGQRPQAVVVISSNSSISVLPGFSPDVSSSSFTYQPNLLSVNLTSSDAGALRINGNGGAFLGNTDLPIGLHSVAIGQNDAVYSDQGVAIGDTNTLNYTATTGATDMYALGTYNIVNNNQGIAIGNLAEVDAASAITIGGGYGTTTLKNSTANSLVVGFNSSAPTLFVGPGATTSTAGQVGVNTISPSGDLDVHQVTNGDTIYNGRRVTDTSPTGNFIQLQNAAATSTPFSVDVSGNTTTQNLSINGSGSQTLLGANPSSFSGNFANFQVASTSQFKVDATGDITNAGTITSTGQINATGGLSVAANQNLTLQSGNGSINQTYLSSGTSSDDLFSFTDTNSGGSNSAQNGIAVQPVGTATSGGTNTINGEKFLNVTPVTNNTFQALNFGTGYNSLVVYNGNTLINGSGVLQSAALSGTYSNTLTLSNATNAITAGTLTATGGTINGTSIGSTTASTASFTTVNTTGSVGINTASVSGNLDVRQIANGNTIIYSRRFTDSSPTGNFIDYQNAAATSDLFKVDVSGNLNTAGSAAFADATASLTAYQFQNAAATSDILDVDTADGDVGVNTNSPSASVYVAPLGAEAGTGTITSSATTVTGSGTAFNTQLHVGDILTSNGGQNRIVTAIASATSLTISAAFSPNITTGTTFVFSQPITNIVDSSGNSLEYINNLDSIGIGTTNPTATLDVNAGANALATVLKVEANAANANISLINNSTGGHTFTLNSSGSAYVLGADNFALNDGSTNRMAINPYGNVGFGASTDLSQLDVAQPADITGISGTTTANASTTITGTSTVFTRQVAVGDRISLSSAASTYATVTAIASNTSLTVSSALGNGTTQTINLKKSIIGAQNNAGATQFILNDQGQVGIGQVAPNATLDVNGSITETSTLAGTGTLSASAPSGGGCSGQTDTATQVILVNATSFTIGQIFYNQTLSKHAAISGVGTCVNGSTYQIIALSNSITTNAAGNVYYIYTPAGNVGIQGTNGNGFINNVYAITVNAGNTTVQSFDLAEQYQTNDPTLKPGDLVSVDPSNSEYIIKTTQPNDPTMLGIVSTAPGLTLGNEDTGTWEKVALSGRVPTNVSLQNGPIKIGDYLTSSSIPGVAMKAIKAGPVIGKALDSFNGTITNADGTTSKVTQGTISVFVKADYFNGTDVNDFITNEAVRGYPATAATGATAGPNNISEITADPALNAANDSSMQILQSILAIQNDPKYSSAESSNVLTDTAVALKEIITPKLTTQSLEVGGLSMFDGGLEADNISSIGAAINLNSDTIFIGRPYFNADTAGFAIINSGQTNVNVTFAKQYLEQPIVNATITENATTDSATAQTDLNALFAGNVQYVVINKSQTGFTIQLSKPAPTDMSFSWIALAVENAKTYFSSVSPQSQQATDVSAASTVSPAPAATPALTPAATPAATSTPATPSPASAAPAAPTTSPAPTDTAASSAPAQTADQPGLQTTN